MIDQEINFDSEQAFMIYANFAGDVVRTAHALNVPAKAVLAVADSENWMGRLGPILELAKSTRPGDLERSINRCLNFVQCNKLRLLLERVLRDLAGMSDTELAEMMVETTTDKLGTIKSKLTTRGLADLASSLEKCHAMSYQALSDTASDRAKRPESDQGGNVGALHIKIAEAMQKAGMSQSPRAQLFSAQISEGQALANAALKKSSPLDDDDH